MPSVKRRPVNSPLCTMKRLRLIIQPPCPPPPYFFAIDTHPGPVKDPPVLIPHVSAIVMVLPHFGGSETYCSAASLFIPSSRTRVIFSFRYLRAGAPCGAALDGMGAVPSTLTLPFVVRVGVAVRWGPGVEFVEWGNGAGDGYGVLLQPDEFKSG